MENRKSIIWLEKKVEKNVSMKLRTLVGSWYIRYRLRTGWGSAYLAEIEGLRNALQSGGVIVLLISAYWHILVPLWVLVIAWVVQKALEYTLGLIDEKYLGWTAKQNGYATSNMNPHFSDMLNRIKNIESMLYENNPSLRKDDDQSSE